MKRFLQVKSVCVFFSHTCSGECCPRGIISKFFAPSKLGSGLQNNQCQEMMCVCTPPPTSTPPRPIGHFIVLSPGGGYPDEFLGTSRTRDRLTMDAKCSCPYRPFEILIEGARLLRECWFSESNSEGNANVENQASGMIWHGWPHKHPVTETFRPYFPACISTQQQWVGP